MCECELQTRFGILWGKDEPGTSVSVVCIYIQTTETLVPDSSLPHKY